MKGTGQWLDIKDVRDKFKDKPEQLAAIERNAERWYDPKREVELLEIVDYSTTQISILKRTLEESWKSTVHERVKKVRTPTKAKTKEENGAAAVGETAATSAAPPEVKVKAFTGPQTRWADKVLAVDSKESKVVTDLRAILHTFKRSATNLGRSTSLPLSSI